MKKTLVALALTPTLFSFCSAGNIYNSFTQITNIVQINAIYTHDETRFACSNDERFIEVYQNYRNYVLPSEKAQEEAILNRIEKDLAYLNQVRLEYPKSNIATNSEYYTFCSEQEEYIQFVINRYSANKDFIEQRKKDIWNNLKAADDALQKQDYTAAKKSYEIALQQIQSIWLSEDLENMVKEQISTIDWLNTKLETIEKAVENKIEETKKEETKVETKNGKTMSEDVERAKKELWDKAAIFDSLVPLFNQKEETIQKRVKTLLNTFKSSKDSYTRNIGIYFWYLVE